MIRLYIYKAIKENNNEYHYFGSLEHIGGQQEWHLRRGKNKPAENKIKIKNKIREMTTRWRKGTFSKIKT